MSNIVNTYEDEWVNAVKGLYCFNYVESDSQPFDFVSLNPAKRKQFKQFIDTPERRPQAEFIQERGQYRPADWPKSSPDLKITLDQLKMPKSRWEWVTVAKKGDIVVSEEGTTSVAVKYGDTQLTCN